MPPSILLADDDAEIRDVVTICFRSKGFNVISVADGEEAVEALTIQNIDAAILDIDMPKLNGYELIEKIRADERWKAIPIIVCTGLTKDSRRSAESWANALHVERFFTKPFNVVELADAAQELIDSKP